MADGELTLKLDDALVEKLERKAAEAGSTPEILAVSLIEQQLFDYDDYEWNEDPREVVTDLEDEAGPTYAAEEVLTEFERRVKERLAAKS